MFKLYVAFIFLCTFFVCGCQHNTSFKDALLNDEAKYYSVFAPISIEYLEFGAKIEQGNIGIIQGVTHRKSSPAELDKFLQRMRKLTPILKEEANWNDLAQKAEGGQIYYYDWKKGNCSANGFLVVHDGKIVYNRVLCTSTLDEIPKSK